MLKEAFDTRNPDVLENSVKVVLNSALIDTIRNSPMLVDQFTRLEHVIDQELNDFSIDVVTIGVGKSGGCADRMLKRSSLFKLRYYHARVISFIDYFVQQLALNLLSRPLLELVNCELVITRDGEKQCKLSQEKTLFESISAHIYSEPKPTLNCPISWLKICVEKSM